MDWIGFFRLFEFNDFHHYTEQNDNTSISSVVAIVVSLVAIGIAVWSVFVSARASRTRRLASIFNMLQDKEIRLARGDLFKRKHAIGNIEELYNSMGIDNNNYVHAMELVCQSFASAHYIFKHDEIQKNPKPGNIVYDSLVIDYHRSIVICYIKSFPLIRFRMENENTTEIWDGYTKLYNEAISHRDKLSDNYDVIADIVMSDGVELNFIFLQENYPEFFANEEGAYEVLLKNLDRLIFN